jgi:SAM-dependent methyltransferase
MAQKNVWEKEYTRPQFLSRENEPQKDVVRFVRWLKKTERFFIDQGGAYVADLGCGTGRNAYYFGSMGNRVFGIDISQKAIDIAQGFLVGTKYEVKYTQGDIGKKIDIPDGQCDIALDVTSSNSLTEAERAVQICQMCRVLKTNRYAFVKVLCKDSDANAQQLLREHAGTEKDTYVLPGVGLTERVFSRTDFLHTYEPYFTVCELQKKTSYMRMNDRVYKRNFWIAYLKKK